MSLKTGAKQRGGDFVHNRVLRPRGMQRCASSAKHLFRSPHHAGPLQHCRYEVGSGLLVAPGVPDIAERQDMQKLIGGWVGADWNSGGWVGGCAMQHSRDMMGQPCSLERMLP